jgi:uncharacterized membrane protein
MITKEMITKAQEQRNRTKHNSARVLLMMSLILLTYSIYMWCSTNDIDFCVLFVVGSLTVTIGVIGLKDK